jgi:hypothetical protein
MNVGEVWAYRSSPQGRFHPVQILDLGKKARVEFEEPSFEGERRWVPRSRLEVLWAGVDAYLEIEQRWEHVADDPVDGDEFRAAEVVFGELIPEEVADLRYDGYKGVVDVPDLGALSLMVKIPEEQLSALPAFIDQDGWHIPWGTTMAVARTAAAMYPDKIFAYIDRLRSKYRGPLVLGEDAENIITGEEYRRSPQKVQEMYAKWEAPLVSILQAWIGEDRVVERADLDGLRRELTRVGDVASRAISALQARSKREGQSYRIELEDQLLPFDFETMLNDEQRQVALAEVRTYFWRNQQSAASPQQPHDGADSHHHS